MSELTDLQEFLKNDLPILEFSNTGLPTASSQKHQERWLQLARQNMHGFSQQACVIRRCIQNEKVQLEIRRRSEENYLLIKTKHYASSDLFMGDNGYLYERVLDGQRVLRHNPGDEIIEDIFVFNLIENPLEAHLERVRCMMIELLYKTGYSNWPLLSATERLALAEHQSSSAEVQIALESLYDSDQTSTLEMFLGDGADEKIRHEILEAGKYGKLRLNIKALGWLLKRPDWNTNSSIISMAQSITAENPKETAHFMIHPNALIRLRLADLVESTEALLQWLSWESHPTVRLHILFSLQKTISPTALTDRLTKTLKKFTTSKKDGANLPPECEIIGWVLANWRQGLLDESNRAAFIKAADLPIGEQNQKKIQGLVKQYSLIKP
ncbi:MAG: hypothetical protein ACI376_06645 [Candidatus Bruticola sp.]